MKLQKRFTEYTKLQDMFEKHVYMKEKLQDFEDAVQREKITFAALSLGLVVEYMSLQYAAVYAAGLADSQKVPQKKRLDKLLEKKILTRKQYDLFLSIAHIRNRYGGHVYLEQTEAEMLHSLIDKYQVLLTEEFQVFYKKCPECRQVNKEKLGDWIFDGLSGAEIFEMGLEFENSSKYDSRYRMAVKCYERAAEKNCPAAYYELIEFFSDPNRGNNKGRVKKYLNKLEQFTDPCTMLYLGYLYSDGITVETDIPKAKTFLEKAGEAGYELAYLELGGLYQYEDSLMVKTDRARACYEKGMEIAAKKEQDTDIWKELLDQLKKE